MRRRIGRAGNSASLLLSQDVLALMGVQIGDEVDLSLVDRALVVRPMPEVERAGRVSQAVTSVMRDWDDMFRRLASGAGADPRPQGEASRRAEPKLGRSRTRAGGRTERRAPAAKTAKRGPRSSGK